MDGRQLEANPERTWMGYSVGWWEGDTLVVDGFGFSDRHVVGRPRAPGAFAKSWTVTYDLQFQPDSEMVEGV